MKILKNILLIIIATVMVFSSGAAVFAADSLSNPKFVRESGEDLALGMGEGVVSGGTIDGDTITVNLKRYGIDFFNGRITEAYYTDSDGNETGGNLVSSDYSTLTLSKGQVSTMPNGKKGIHLSLHFTFTPYTPSAMGNGQKAYFTCDDIQ